MRKLIFVGSMLLGFFYYLSMRNYALFHFFAEGFTIMVSFSIAVIVFNNYKHLRNIYTAILGIAYCSAGFFDILHTFANSTANSLSNFSPNVEIQMWIIARYLDSIGMLVAGISLNKTIKPFHVFITYLAVAIMALLAVFYWGIFPDCFIKGQGLTSFKIYSEYIICMIIIFSALLLLRHKSRFEPEVYHLLLAFFFTSICTELTLTLFRHMYSSVAAIGHLLKMLAFFFLYKAIVETSLKEPYNRLEKLLSKVSNLNIELEHMVNQRTAKLMQANRQLQQEIKQRKKVEKHIRNMAYHDSLTGLPNRKMFEERLRQELAKAKSKNQILGIGFLDLDKFKNINDTFGHQAGDQLLCAVARKLQAVLRANDMVARWGGDEFIFLLSDIEFKTDIDFVINRITTILHQLGQNGELGAPITASIGISVFPWDGVEEEVLLKNADVKMYQAKKNLEKN